MDREILEDRLRHIALDLIIELEYPDEILKFLRLIIQNIIQKGIRTMEAEDVLDSEQRILEAEENLTKLISEILRKAQSPNISFFTGDRESIYEDLCPIWPFC